MVLCKVTWVDDEYNTHKDYILCRSIDYKDTLELLDDYYHLSDITDLYMYPLEDSPLQLSKETFNKIVRGEERI